MLTAAIRTHAAAALQWPARAMRSLYLRVLIVSAEKDRDYMQASLKQAGRDLAVLPKQIEVHNRHISMLRVKLIDVESA